MTSTEGDELDAIRARRAAINPIGNWIVYDAPGKHKGEYLEITDGMTPIAQVFNRDDCTFLQHAPTDIYRLFDVIERQSAEITDLRSQLQVYEEQIGALQARLGVDSAGRALDLSALADDPQVQQHLRETSDGDPDEDVPTNWGGLA